MFAKITQLIRQALTKGLWPAKAETTGKCRENLSLALGRNIDISLSSCYGNKIMKQGIHPEYFNDATIKCGCGAVYKIGSTVKEMTVEICSACHPYYTGAHRFVDTAGRIDKFRARLEKKNQFQKSNSKSNSKS